jgi:hypothetical protein
VDRLAPWEFEFPFPSSSFSSVLLSTLHAPPTNQLSGQDRIVVFKVLDVYQSSPESGEL